ncbi:HEPN domain-containing protein [Phormidium sp. FACHB-1136]|uniref:HEPN domain-containing protein n=1 Tax=Phormidium sp. FACHB-1136 TaxID=2692848 RepID=UPI0016897081|nr:HEPN domain-containing protein [Phormidium sp. FACHB-1136]MBD2426647.1 HEPN domain-containing protein [Phormidium sp. FACHB-1136]
MSEMNKILVETRRWLAYAQRDFTAAQALAREGDRFAPQICVLSQQAAEKSLKAALIFLQIEFPFRHDLELLASLFPKNLVCSQLTNLPRLTEWTVESRYPSRLEEPTLEDAQTALELAQEVLSSVQADLVQQGFSLSP